MIVPPPFLVMFTLGMRKARPPNPRKNGAVTPTPPFWVQDSSQAADSHHVAVLRDAEYARDSLLAEAEHTRTTLQKARDDKLELQRERDQLEYRLQVCSDVM